MAPMQPVRRESDRYEPRGIQCDQITAMAVRRASASCLSANAIAIGRTGCTCMASRHERPRANPRRGKGGPRTDNRRFLNSLLWMARPGGRWRDLPELIGRLRKREAPLLPLDRDGCSGCHPRALAREADLKWLIIDSTIVRAHQQAAGARRKKGADGPALS
jgi:transposase